MLTPNELSTLAVLAQAGPDEIVRIKELDYLATQFKLSDEAMGYATLLMEEPQSDEPTVVRELREWVKAMRDLNG